MPFSHNTTGLAAEKGAAPVLASFSRTVGNRADKLRMPRSAAYSAAE